MSGSTVNRLPVSLLLFCALMVSAILSAQQLNAQSRPEDIEQQAARETYRILAEQATPDHPRAGEAFRVVDRGFPHFFENPELPPLAIVAAHTVDDDDSAERRDEIVRARQELRRRGYLEYLTDGRTRGGILYLAQTPIFQQFPKLAEEASQAFSRLRDEAFVRACAAQGRFLEGAIELGVLDDVIAAPRPGPLDQALLQRSRLIEQGVDCPGGGGYLVNPDGSIVCSVHGDGSNAPHEQLMSDDDVARLRSRNPFFREIYDRYH